MAGNTATIADPADGLFSDWFELYNAGNTALDLSGFYLNNSATNKGQFQIPNGRIIPAGGYLLVWADRNINLNTNAGDLHVDFKLGKTGETIGLFAPNGALVDTVSFGVQSDDISQGRFPDGGAGVFQFFTKPTPGSSNNGSGQTEIITLSASLTPSGIVLTWNTQTGAKDQIEYKNSLTETKWLSLGTIISSANPMSITNQFDASQERYFRVEHQNP